MKLKTMFSTLMVIGITTSVFSQTAVSNGKSMCDRGDPAIPPPGFMGGMHGPMGNPPFVMMDIGEIENLMNEIGLDKGRQSKIRVVVRNFMNLLDDRMIKIQKEDLNVRGELLNDKPDLTIIQNVINKKTKFLAEIEFAQVKRDLEIKFLLTQDEYDHWKSAMRSRMKLMMPPPMEKNIAPPNQGKEPLQK